MSEPVDEPTTRIEQALSESQRLEREESRAALERQSVRDQRVIDALAKPEG